MRYRAPRVYNWIVSYCWHPSIHAKHLKAVWKWISENVIQIASQVIFQMSRNCPASQQEHLRAAIKWWWLNAARATECGSVRHIHTCTQHRQWDSYWVNHCFETFCDNFRWSATKRNIWPEKRGSEWLFSHQGNLHPAVTENRHQPEISFFAAKNLVEIENPPRAWQEQMALQWGSREWGKLSCELELILNSPLLRITLMIPPYLSYLPLCCNLGLC